METYLLFGQPLELLLWPHKQAFGATNRPLIHRVPLRQGGLDLIQVSLVATARHHQLAQHLLVRGELLPAQVMLGPLREVAAFHEAREDDRVLELDRQDVAESAQDPDAECVACFLSHGRHDDVYAAGVRAVVTRIYEGHWEWCLSKGPAPIQCTSGNSTVFFIAKITCLSSSSSSFFR